MPMSVLECNSRNLLIVFYFIIIPETELCVYSISWHIKVFHFFSKEEKLYNTLLKTSSQEYENV